MLFIKLLQKVFLRIYYLKLLSEGKGDNHIKYGKDNVPGRGKSLQKDLWHAIACSVWSIQESE